MDPQLSPFVEKAVTRGPVAKFEVREKKRGGRESTIQRLDAAGKSPEDLSEEIWNIIEDDYAGRLGEHHYAVVYYRPDQDEPEERKPFWLKGDHSSAEKDPELRLLEFQERALEAREAHIRDCQMQVLDGQRLIVQAQNAIILKQEARLDSMQQRELDVITTFAELSDKKAAHQLEMRKEDRKDQMVSKLETYGMQFLAEAMKGKDGSVPPVIQNEIIQKFVDSLNDKQLDAIMSNLREDQKAGLITVLQPFILKAIEKQQAAQQAPQQVGPTQVVGAEVNGVNTPAPPSGAPS